MISYNSNEYNRIKNLLSDYIYLKSKEKDLDGILLVPYYDDTYNFDLLHFYKKDNNLATVQTIKVEDNLLRYVYFNSEKISLFDDVVTGYILYDPNNLLNSCKQQLINSNKEFNRATNEVGFDEEFISSISSSDKNDSNIEDVLTDYYKNIISNNDYIDVYNYEYCYSFINRNVPKLLTDDVNIHSRCLLNARYKSEELISANIKQKKLSD